jgi:hypothetical protein
MQKNVGIQVKTTIMVFMFLSVFVFGSCTTYDALESSPYDAQLQDALSTVNSFIVINPQAINGGVPEIGIVFYPGGLVKPEAYIPLAWAVADESGALVVIVPMPFDLAVLSPQRGVSVPKEFPAVKTWYAGGHSLGGAMASSLVLKNPDIFSGLILLAAYPAKSSSLADSTLPVLSVYAQFDGLATLEKIANTRNLLPQNARFIMIEGGNHASFGNYGDQKNDGKALISAQEQWTITAKAIANFL